MRRIHATAALWKAVVVVAAILFSLAIGSVFIAAVGRSPLSAYRELLLTPFSSWVNFGELLTKLTPLLIVGVGMAIGRQGNLTNLGGEGQIYMGALGLLLVCLYAYPTLPPVLTVALGVAAAALFGGAWGALSGALKAYFRANEIITSLLLNYIAVNLIGFLLRGPLQEPSGLVPESAKIDQALRLSKLIPMSRAHTGILLALALVGLYYLFIQRTRTGYCIRVLGGGERAARYSGVDVKKYHLGVMALSGAIAGIAGGVEVLGVHYRLTETLAGSIGFSGMVVALLGMLDPVGMVFSALLLALLSTGAQYMQVISGVPTTLVDILQGLIVLFVLFGLSFDLSETFQRKEHNRQ